MTLYRWYTCGGQKAAAANGCSGIVTLLLEHGADPDQMTTEKWTALHNASSAGHHVVVHILIQANVRLEEGGVVTVTVVVWKDELTDARIHLFCFEEEKKKREGENAHLFCLRASFFLPRPVLG